MLSDYRDRVDKLVAMHTQAKAQVKAERAKLETADNRVLDVEDAQRVIQQVAQGVQQQAHDKIASVVSRCLEAVFDNPYQFSIEFVRKRGKTEAVLAFKRGQHVVDPNTASGGGCVDVAAFALRLACLMLARPAARRVMIMDEPFKFVNSPIYVERIRVLLHTLAEEMGVQFIMSTGKEDLQTGKVIEL